MAADKILEDISKVVRGVRELVEGSPLPRDASTAAVFIAAFVVVGKSHGMSREQIHKVIDDIWALDTLTGG